MAGTATRSESLRWLVENHELRRMVRFLLTGLTAFSIDFWGLVFLHSGLNWGLRLSVLVAYPIGGIVHYALTRYWVFPPRTVRSESRRLGGYLLLGLVNFLLTLVAMLGLVRLGVDYRVAKVACVACLVVINYVVTDRLVMR